MHSTPTKSLAGGVALYVKSSLDYKPREDLSACKDEFEMVGIEILSSESKIILCCCVYRYQTLMHKRLLIIWITCFRN